MSYTYLNAIKTAYNYLDIDINKVEVIKNTNKRGIVYDFNGIKTVIFIYPISCKKDNKQNFFDTRDSGAKERRIAWQYAQKNGLRYFCLGFNEEQERYKNYILSLESDENSISNISFRKATNSEATGTQVNIPNDFIPTGKFLRVKTPKGFFISAIKKDYIREYIELFDNRPYMLDSNAELDIENTEERNKRLFKYWLRLQPKESSGSDVMYSESTAEQYIRDINNLELADEPGKNVFCTTNVHKVEVVLEKINLAEDKYYPQISALNKYLEYLKQNNKDEILNNNLWGIHIKEKNDALSVINPHICIGWSSMGDLSTVSDKNALTVLYDEHFEKNNRGRGQDIGQIWRFLHDVREGDYVIFVEKSVFHIGRVESGYYYDNNDYDNQSTDYRNTRKVRWLKKNISRAVLSSDLHNSLKTAMTIWGLNDYKSAVIDLLRGTYQKDDRDEEAESMKLKFETGLDSEYKRNRILFGAPGTGKSFTLEQEKVKLLGKDNETDYERVTFHPDYSYANFVGTYKPMMVKNGETKDISYEYVPGPFMRVLVKALQSAMSDNPKPILLIVEEINRANVAAVFGEIFQLLDRNKKNSSEYSISTTNDMRTYLAEKLNINENDVETIKLPDTMFIWATMNSADQGVFPMDTAFKRRWDFTYLGINDAVKTYSEIIKNKKYLLGKGQFTRLVSWNDLREAINDVLSTDVYNINEDKLLGPYFIAKKILESDKDSDFIDAFKNKVLMYLFDDAVKQKKDTFFAECKDTNDAKKIRYSEICKLFDSKGVFIFVTEISKRFTDKPQEEKVEADI